MAKAKTNPLAAALARADEPKAEQQAPAVAATPTSAPTQDAKSGRKDRANTVLIGGHFAPEVKQALRMLAAEENTTSQALIGEALNMLFVKKGKGKVL